MYWGHQVGEDEQEGVGHGLCILKGQDLYSPGGGGGAALRQREEQGGNLGLFTSGVF